MHNMSTSKTKLLTKYKTPIVVVAVVILTIASIATAATMLKVNPKEENAIDTPLVPTPTPTASPSPTPIVTATEIHMTSNLTVGSYYQTDYLEITAQLNQPIAGIPINLYNTVSGTTNLVTTLPSDNTGKVVFVRHPQNPFNYSVGFY